MSACRRASIALVAALALLVGAAVVHAHSVSSAVGIEAAADVEAAGEACWLCRSSVKHGGPPAGVGAGLSRVRAADPAPPVLRCASRHREPAAARAPPSIAL